MADLTTAVGELLKKKNTEENLLKTLKPSLNLKN